MVDWKKIALFAGGTLFGTAGVKILASDDAKKVYTQCTAAVLRAKDCVMKTVTTVQENAGDIYEDAKTINEERAAAKEAAVVEDAEKAEEAVEEASEPAECRKRRIRERKTIRGRSGQKSARQIMVRRRQSQYSDMTHVSIRQR